MNTRHAAAVKANIKKLNKGQTLAFFYATDGADIRVLHVSKKSGDIGRFGDVKKVNKHIRAKKFGDPLPDDCKLCVGLVRKQGKSLYFSLRRKRGGASAADLKKGLLKMKGMLRLAKCIVAEPPPEQEGADNKGLLSMFKKKDRSQEQAEEEAFQEAEAELVRQETKLLRRGREFSKDPRGLSDERLQKLREGLRAYRESGGDNPDLIALSREIRAERRRRRAFRDEVSRLTREAAPLSDASAALLQEAQALLGAPIVPGETADSDEMLQRLRALVDRLSALADSTRTALAA